MTLSIILALKRNLLCLVHSNEGLWSSFVSQISGSTTLGKPRTFSVQLLATRVFRQRYIPVKLSQCLGTELSRCMAQGSEAPHMLKLDSPLRYTGCSTFRIYYCLLSQTVLIRLRWRKVVTWIRDMTCTRACSYSFMYS